jgi:sterol desaturase/sphingolipid hydroxylase (fatty acid hydroxylase superfamily)
MDDADTLFDLLRGFLGLDDALRILGSGDPRSLLTYEGLARVVAPLIPLLIVLEFVRGLALRRVGIDTYRIPFLACLTNALIGRFVSIGTVLFCIGLLEPVAPLALPMNAWGFVVGYVVWELAHYVYHRLAHRVRLLWCLHATHHAPEHMNLSVSHAHFFLEAPYADLVRTSICVMLGVPPPMLFAIMLVDGTWGAFIHVGDTLLRKADLGVLGRFVLTPSHHRVHHARNAAYRDTNYCNLLNVWDRVFGTYQPERPDLEPEYGIARKTGPTGFLDAYFGEIVALARDVRTAPGARNKLLYLFMPPGWRHAGDRGTAGAPRAALRVGR